MPAKPAPSPQTPSSALLAQLSSQVGDRTQESTLRVAALCLNDPSLLKEVAAGLTSKDARLAADCAEVFTQVGLQRPDFVAPYAEQLAAQLDHKASRVRWESVHALSLIAATPPAVKTIAELLPRLSQIIQSDTSIIVRDYATSTLATYASAGPKTAKEALPHLEAALTAWDSKHAARALEGLKHVATHHPALRPTLLPLALTYADHGKSTTRQAAKSLLRLLK
jgi:hypothetical protein